MRRTAASSVKKTKNNWFQQKVQLAEDKVMRGVGRWKGNRDIQRGRVGLLPTKLEAIRSLNAS